MATRRSSGRLTTPLALVAVVSPLLVLIAAFGVKFGVWSAETGWRVLTWQVAWGFAFVGAAAALGALATAFGNLRQRGVAALAALLIAGATLGGFLYQRTRLAEAGSADISSDLSDPPAVRVAERLSPEIGGPQDCPGLRTVRTQVAPGVAAWALEQAGFTARGAAAFRADGARQGFWFGFSHEATIRIRPGQTDVRVVARYPAADAGEACRLAVRLVEALETR